MLPDYRHPAVPLTVWLGLLVAAWRLVPCVRGGGLTRGQAAAAVAVALAAVARWAGTAGRMPRPAPWTGPSSARSGCSRSRPSAVPPGSGCPGRCSSWRSTAFFHPAPAGHRGAGHRPARGGRVRDGADPGRVRRPAAHAPGPRPAGRPPGRAGQPAWPRNAPRSPRSPDDRRSRFARAGDWRRFRCCAGSRTAPSTRPTRRCARPAPGTPPPCGVPWSTGPAGPGELLAGLEPALIAARQGPRPAGRGPAGRRPGGSRPGADAGDRRCGGRCCGRSAAPTGAAGNPQGSSRPAMRWNCT